MNRKEARRFCLDWLYWSKDRKTISGLGWQEPYIEDVVSMLVEATKDKDNT